MRLEISDVTKTYSDGKTAVAELDLSVECGVLGLLGPNGAGKSTLMRILATITRPTSGRVTWNGTDIVKQPEPLRRILGYLPQDFGVYPNLRAREFLSYLAALKGLSRESARARIAQLLKLVNLTAARERPLGKYSGGMRQRIGIAQALLNDPQLLIVDEPTAGLDPEERVRFRGLLSDLAADRIVIVSTHIVSDLEAIADDIAIVVGGRLRKRGAPGDLLRELQGQVWDVLVATEEFNQFRAHHMISRAVRTPAGVRARVLSTTPPARAVALMPDLEDVYLRTVNSPPGAG